MHDRSGNGMRSEIEMNVIIARFEDGEDFFKAMGEMAARHNVRSGVILTGIGMLRDAEIGLFDGKEYRKEVLEGAYELVALHGTIALLDGKPYFHVHAGLSGGDHVMKGGHLFRATVCVTNEISVRVFRDIEMVRARNERTGLSDLKMSKISVTTGTKMSRPGRIHRTSLDLDMDQ